MITSVISSASDRPICTGRPKYFPYASVCPISDMSIKLLVAVSFVSFLNMADDNLSLLMACPEHFSYNCITCPNDVHFHKKQRVIN